MNQEYVQNLFERKTNNILASLSYNGLDNYVSRIYNQKVPDYIKQYLAPERKYIDNLAHELNGHIYGMQRNFFKNIRDNPKEAMKKTLEELLFSSKEKKEEFGAKVSDTVEELSYAAQVMAAKGYEIWTVKYNTPVVGNFARRELRRRTGREDLPTFEETKRNIDALKQSTYNFLEYTGFDSHHRMPEESVKQRYHQRMRQYGGEGNNRRLLAYDLENGLHKPKNAREERSTFEANVRREWHSRRPGLEDISFDEYMEEREDERKWRYINNPHNSWFEKLIGYIGYFFGF